MVYRVHPPYRRSSYLRVTQLNKTAHPRYPDQVIPRPDRPGKRQWNLRLSQKHNFHRNRQSAARAPIAFRRKGHPRKFKARSVTLLIHECDWVCSQKFDWLARFFVFISLGVTLPSKTVLAVRRLTRPLQNSLCRPNAVRSQTVALTTWRRILWLKDQRSSCRRMRQLC
jgi:hypothetical protein